MPRHIPCTVAVRYADGERETTTIHGLADAIVEAKMLWTGQGEPGISDIYSIDVVRMDTECNVYHSLGPVTVP